MKSFEKKGLDIFSEIIINKGLIHEAGFGNRAIPTYVGEWIIANYVEDSPSLTEEIRERIAAFVRKYIPEKGQKEAFKNRLYEQEEIRILDNFSVYVNLVKGDRYLNIPYLDESSAFLTPQIVQDNEMLLSSGLWGLGTLFYIPPSDENPRGQIWMKEFKPFQLANIDIEYFCESREKFSIEEWIDLIVSSMGFNHEIYSVRQKIILISRLLPMVEPRFNLVEPAPKGTGKSFVFDNMSRYVAVRSGSISAAVMFFNDSRKTPGLITRYDCVVIDEAQKVKADTSGELTALLKSYLESGRFGRGSSGTIPAEAGIALLANIDIDENGKPINEEIGIFRYFPNFLRETAFIDRFSGLLPGWYLPRITKNTPSRCLGFKGDIFGEILHTLRGDISYKDYIKTNIDLVNCDDMRDAKAIEAGASGLMKILFPDKNLSEDEFYMFCVNPAVELRQRVRDELCKLDREYKPITIKSKHPDVFQKSHKLPAYYYVDDEGRKIAIKSDLKPGIQVSVDISKEQKTRTSDLSEEIDILDIIKSGESEKVEFKSTFHFDVHNKQLNKGLRLNVIKAIAAFMNSKGGTLLIGIDDKAKILGLKNDYSLLGKKRNKDGFELSLSQEISNRIGDEFFLYISIDFPTVEKKEICRIHVKMSDKPVFVKENGNKSFYIRSGNSTRQLTTDKVVDYIKSRWEK